MNAIEIRSLELVQKEVSEQLQIDKFLENAMNFEVSCEKSAQNALSMALQSRKLEKSLEQSRSEIIKPHLDYQRSINKLVKDFQATLDAIENNLKAKLEKWINEQQDNPLTYVDKLSVVDGSLHVNSFYDFEVMDHDRIPSHYMQCIVDSAAIEKAIREGARDIPGIRIFLSQKTTMRVKN